MKMLPSWEKLIIVVDVKFFHLGDQISTEINSLVHLTILMKCWAFPQKRQLKEALGKPLVTNNRRTHDGCRTATKQTISLQIFERLSSTNFTWSILWILCPIFSYNDRIRFCPYMGKYGSVKIVILAYFTQWSFLVLTFDIQRLYIKEVIHQCSNSQLKILNKNL